MIVSQNYNSTTKPW